MDQTFFLEQQLMPSHSLYMVGTPIGNLGDITYRAVHILKNVDGIACEDTRHTSNLLNAIGIQKPLLAIHEHNEIEAANNLITRLKNGERWAYVCDAGTPGISDPGAKLTDEVRKADLKIIPIPGPSAVSTLVSVAGQLTAHAQTGFQFIGFLPLKGKDRKDALAILEKNNLSVIFYESPQRIKNTLTEIFENISDKSRNLVIGRELTKKFEAITYSQIQDIPQLLSSHFEERGEFCIILGGANKLSKLQTLDKGEIEVDPLRLIKALSPFVGSKQIAEIFSNAGLMSKKAAYELSLQTKNPL
jgi:16S rRNA (cytidine1402-2'-O)-methyltransferase